MNTALFFSFIRSVLLLAMKRGVGIVLGVTGVLVLVAFILALVDVLVMDDKVRSRDALIGQQSEALAACQAELNATVAVSLEEAATAVASPLAPENS